MKLLQRDSAGRIAVHGRRVTLLDEAEGSVTDCACDDLPDDVLQSEITELALILPGSRTRSGRPGLPPAVTQPGSLEGALQEARQRAALAAANRDAAMAEFEATQARIAAAHLTGQVERKRAGTSGGQLFLVGLGGWFAGMFLGAALGALLEGAGADLGVSVIVQQVGGLIGVVAAVRWRLVRARQERLEEMAAASGHLQVTPRTAEEIQRRQQVRARMEEYRAERPTDQNNDTTHSSEPPHESGG